MDCTPNALAIASATFKGLEDGQVQAIITYLLCQWVNK